MHCNTAFDSNSLTSGNSNQLIIIAIVRLCYRNCAQYILFRSYLLKCVIAVVGSQSFLFVDDNVDGSLSAYVCQCVS